MLERGSRRQELREAMTCFVFATRTVRLAEEIKKGNDSQEEEEEESRKEEAEERKERRDRGQSSSHGVRSTERLIFFPSFFIPASRASGGLLSLSLSLSLSLAFCLCRESCRVRAFHLSLCPSSFFCTDRPPNISSSTKPLVFFSWVPAPSPTSRACTRPFFCRIFPVPPFVATLRDAGAARCSRGTRTAGGREAQGTPELQRAQSRAANEVAIQRFTISPRVPSGLRNG